MPDATTKPYRVDPIKIAYGEQMVDTALKWYASMLNVINDPMGIAPPTTALMELCAEIQAKLKERDG